MKRNLMVGKKHYEPGEVHRPTLKREGKRKGEGEVKRRRGKDGRGRKEMEREEEGREGSWIKCQVYKHRH